MELSLLFVESDADLNDMDPENVRERIKKELEITNSETFAHATLNCQYAFLYNIANGRVSDPSKYYPQIIDVLKRPLKERLRLYEKAEAEIQEYKATVFTDQEKKDIVNRILINGKTKSVKLIVSEISAEMQKPVQAVKRVYNEYNAKQREKWNTLSS